MNPRIRADGAVSKNVECYRNLLLDIGVLMMHTSARHLRLLLFEPSAVAWRIWHWCVSGGLTKLQVHSSIGLRWLEPSAPTARMGGARHWNVPEVFPNPHKYPSRARLCSCSLTTANYAKPQQHSNTGWSWPQPSAPMAWARGVRYWNVLEVYWNPQQNASCAGIRNWFVIAVVFQNSQRHYSVGWSWLQPSVSTAWSRGVRDWNVANLCINIVENFASCTAMWLNFECCTYFESLSRLMELEALERAAMNSWID